MNPDSSSSGNSAGKQPEGFEGGSQNSRNAHLTLYPLYQQAEATKAKIQRTISQLPRIVAQAEEYLTPEMANVAEAYFSGICSEDPSEAAGHIEEAIGRMQAFYNDLGNRMRADTIRALQELADPGNGPAPTSPTTSLSSKASERSAMSTRGQQQAKSGGVLSGEPHHNSSEAGPEHPGCAIMGEPAPPVRRVTFADTASTLDPLPGPSFRRSLSFMPVVSSFSKSAGESKRERVKDLWRKVRSRLRKEDPSF